MENRDHPLGDYKAASGHFEPVWTLEVQGMETARPRAGSTTATHSDGFEPGSTETYPVVEVKISIERDVATLATVMDAITFVHHYEEPVIFLREDWVSRAAYNPDNDNPNRWWNNGRGLPDRIDR